MKNLGRNHGREVNAVVANFCGAVATAFPDTGVPSDEHAIILLRDQRGRATYDISSATKCGCLWPLSVI